MRRVTKSAEPAAVGAYRKQHATATWEELKDHLSTDGLQRLREALARDQGGLCVYCESKLSTERGKAVVEHFHPKKHSADTCLAYGTRSDWATRWDNLFAACMGGQGHAQEEHCDRPKGEKDLCAQILEPLRMSALAHLRVAPLAGTIHVDEQCPPNEAARAQRTIDELRLGARPLNSMRAEFVGEVLRGLDERSATYVAKGWDLEAAIAKARDDEASELLQRPDDLPPFVTALRSVLGDSLDRRLHSLGLSL